MNKRFRWGVIFAIIMLLMAGCSAGKDKASTDSGSKGSGDKVTLSFYHWRGEDAKVFDSIIKQFEAKNPNIKVESNILPAEQYQEIALSKIKDGSAGDVFASFPGAQFEAGSEAGLYADLSNEAFLSNFNSNLIIAGQKDKKQYALPYQLVYNMPVYNMGMFEELDIELPTDWESFLAMCEKLKDNGIIPIAFPGDDGPGQFMNPMMMNNQPDEEIWAKVEAGEAKVTEEWWVKTLAQIKELNDKGYFQDGALGTKKPVAAAMVAQEKAAMVAMGSYLMASIKQQNPDIQLGVLAPYTVNEDKVVWEGIHTTTFMLGVNSKSKHQEEAKKFIEFLSTKEIAGEYANETGQHVTVNDVEYKTDELKNAAVWMDKNTRFQPRYLIKSAEVQTAIMESLRDVIAGTKPEEAAKKAQTIIDENI